MPVQHIPHQSAEGEDRCESKKVTILVYPTSLCMVHTQETGKLSDNPNWLPVDQCGFGEQFMHLSKSVIGKD